MATLAASAAPISAPSATATGYGNVANLSTGQTGNGASTNIVDRGGSTEVALIQLTTAIGATPTCTYAVEGSVDGTTWFAVPYADSATPLTVTVATFVITTAITARKIVQANVPVRFLRLTYSANTNVTNTADIYVF
jgi:hypothetical protein